MSFRTRFSSKRKEKEHPLLFPGLLLSNRVRKIQYATQIVGEVFERMSHSFAGPKWYRVNPGSDVDVRPDLSTADNLNFVESKATQWRFKITTPQLKHYAELVEDNAKLKQRCDVVYYLWTYGDKTIRLVEDGKTVGGVVNLCVKNVQILDVIHWSIIYAMLQKLPTNVTYNEYHSWKRAILDGEPFKVMQFGSPILNRLRLNPRECLSKELGLDPDLYDLQPQRFKRKRQSIEFDNVPFESKPFNVNQFTLKKDVCSFPEFHRTDSVPF